MIANLGKALQRLGPPQWSRPMTGRMRMIITNPKNAVMPEWPQWGRPMGGRMTSRAAVVLADPDAPQWGRPLNGRMTRC